MISETADNYEMSAEANRSFRDATRRYTELFPEEKHQAMQSALADFFRKNAHK